jgi:transcriptional regulator GlxA family with amidase domain
MSETEFSLTFIAGSCGFPSQRVFSRVFRAAEAWSPSAFRRQARSATPPAQIRPPANGNAHVRF